MISALLAIFHGWTCWPEPHALPTIWLEWLCR